MSLNATPTAERVHIGIFGRRNAGKSSLINAITGQNLAIVSDIKGTTTDPVLKTMELLPLGPVVIIDTPGLDDEGDLGEQRVRKAYLTLNKTDIAVLVVDAFVGMTDADAGILKRIQEKHIPYVVVFNKADLTELTGSALSAEDLNRLIKYSRGDSTLPAPAQCIAVSTTTGKNIHRLKDLIAAQMTAAENPRRIVADLIHPLDFIILVVPIDSSAPKGRLILPQQQTIRDILEAGAVSVVVKDTELEQFLAKAKQKPDLVITDSQVFAKVSKIVPADIPLTSFSILFARYKGNLPLVVHGAHILDELRDGDVILISEGCTHHRQCEDIGTVKLPRLIRKHTGKEIHFEFSSGTEFPDDLRPYRLVIHCGGCTLNEREMKYRLKCAEEQNVPITNYGTAIAHMTGILGRSTEIFRLDE